MFLRRYQRRSGGRRRTYWALVESVRTGRGSRQRVVACPGELKRSEQNGWAQLGRKLSGKQRPQPSLFDPSDDEPVLGRVQGESACPARLLARQPSRLPAGLHRVGGDDRRDSPGIRGVRREP